MFASPIGLQRELGVDRRTQPSMSHAIATLDNPINRFGVAKTVGGVQIFGDGLIRAQYAGFKK